MTHTQLYNLLLVEDDTRTREMFEKAFSRCFNVKGVGTLEEAVTCLKENVPDAVLVDVDLEKTGGQKLDGLRVLGTLDVLKGANPDVYSGVQTAMMSGRHAEDPEIRGMIPSLTIGYFAKPFTSLTGTIQNIYAKVDNTKNSKSVK